MHLIFSLLLLPPPIMAELHSFILLYPAAGVELDFYRFDLIFELPSYLPR